MAGKRRARRPSAALSMALEEMGALRPTGIQKASFSPLRNGESALLSCATGTGKTIAYLAPLCERMKEIERSMGGMGSRRASKRPLAVVVAPTRELCAQIGDVSKKFSHALKFRSTVVAKGSRTLGQQLKRLEAGVDIVVGTPGQIQKARDRDGLYFSAVEMLVFDEADTLVSAGEFGREAESLVTSVRSKPTCQLVYVSATPTGELRHFIRRFSMGGEIAQLG